MRLILEAVSFALAAINMVKKKKKIPSKRKKEAFPETRFLVEVLLFGKCDDNIGVALHLLG